MRKKKICWKALGQHVNIYSSEWEFNGSRKKEIIKNIIRIQKKQKNKKINKKVERKNSQERDKMWMKMYKENEQNITKQNKHFTIQWTAKMESY